MWHVAGYYDESDDNERAYSIAGFVGHQQDCVGLDFAWRERILEKYGIKYFKASELNSGTGQFAQFRDDPTRLDAFFSKREKDLFNEIKIASIDLILEFDLLMGVGAVLMLPDYYRLLEEYKRIGKIIPAPYFFCAQLIMMESGFMMHKINRHLHGFRQGVLRPILDWQEEYKGRAALMFDEFCRKNPISAQFLLPPFYEDDQHYLMLQAADNLAYECRRLVIIQEYDTHLPERRAMQRLKKQIHKVYKLDYESMKVVMEAQEPDQIPFEAEIHNRHELLSDLESLEREMARNSEYDQFDQTMRNLMKVSHDEIKTQLDAERAAKNTKRKAKKEPSASDRADGKTD